MALDGPKQDNVALFQSIADAKGADKIAMMKALSPTLQREYLLHLQMLKAGKKIERLEGELATLDAREAVLMSKDSTLLTQAATSYAPKAAVVQTQVHTGPVVDSASRYGSKFNQ